MPAFESQLSAQEIEDLIVFIRSTEEDVDETPVVVDDPRETCPDITYVGDGDAPVGFDVAGEDFHWESTQSTQSTNGGRSSF